MASDSKRAIIKMRVAHHVGLINNVIYIIDHVGVTNLYEGEVHTMYLVWDMISCLLLHTTTTYNVTCTQITLTLYACDLYYICVHS